LVKLSGISVVAFATGSISSRLIAAVVTKGKGMGSTRAKGHILICGWSGKGAEILRELRAKEVEDGRAVVVLANLPDDPTRGLAEFISGNPSDVDDLIRAGIADAGTAIVLADESNSPASDSDRDARTLLTCLALESVNPDCYSCVEVVRSENRDHFSRTRADELVVSAELTGALLASSARTHGLSAVVSDLLTHPEGSEFYHLPVPDAVATMTVREAIGWVKDNLDAMLIGVGRVGQRFELNPPASRLLRTDELLLVVAPRVPARPGD
jgi:voltage-gated potassium channel